jgi:hypothetical protein
LTDDRGVAKLGCMPVSRWSLALALLLTIGCGGGDDDDDDTAADAALVDAGGDVDGPAPVDAGADADLPIDASGPCNELGNAAPAITARRDADDAPAAVGGAVQPGTYYLTEDVFFETVDAELGPEQGTMTISGTTVQLVTAIGKGPDLVSTSTFATTNPNQIVLMQVCPNQLTQGWQLYTANATTFALHQINDQPPMPFHRVQTWTRQD